MAWIKTIKPEDATGLLKRMFDDSIRRAGKVFNVVSVQSLRPKVMRASLGLYSEVMFSPDSDLSRSQREMIATAVARHNNCHY